MRFELVPVVQKPSSGSNRFQKKSAIRTRPILPLSRGCVAVCESENCHSEPKAKNLVFLHLQCIDPSAEFILSDIEGPQDNTLRECRRRGAKIRLNFSNTKP